MKSQTKKQNILGAVPDLPRWVEARAMLLSNRGKVLDFQLSPEPTGAIYQEDIGLAVVIGRPSGDLLAQVSNLADEVICPLENAECCSTSFAAWDREIATLFLPNSKKVVAEVSSADLRLLKQEDLTDPGNMPPSLYAELHEELRLGTTLYCSTENGMPVAFCFSGASSELFWSISVETLIPYRRSGHATRLVQWVIKLKEAEGLKPVWGAVNSNRASREMARRLNFSETDQIMVFTRK